MIQVLFQYGEGLGWDRLRSNWTWYRVFEFADEVIEIIVEFLQLPKGDAVQDRFCKTNAIRDTLVDLMDAGEDVAGGDKKMMWSLKVVPGWGRRVIRPLESVFRELMHLAMLSSTQSTSAIRSLGLIGGRGVALI
jgi:hypothetical protein